MTLFEAVKQAQLRFDAISDSARLDAECLLAFVLDKPMVYLRTWPDNPLEPNLETQFARLVERRAGGEPIAYIVGQIQFWSLDLSVNNNTLIPRPDTELLVEQVLKLNSKKTFHSILELGTGTGAIAIAISSELSKLQQTCVLTATDVSKKALEIAQVNASKHHQAINFIQSDWFESLPTKKFDLIISNPPYVEADDPHLQTGDVQFEPNIALASGKDGLDAIRIIIRQSAQRLNSGGYLILEHGFDQAVKVRRLLDDYGYQNAHTCQDIANNDRITISEYI